MPPTAATDEYHQERGAYQCQGAGLGNRLHIVDAQHGRDHVTLNRWGTGVENAKLAGEVCQQVVEGGARRTNRSEISSTQWEKGVMPIRVGGQGESQSRRVSDGTADEESKAH